MSLLDIPAYLEAESTIAAALTAADEATLTSIEDAWMQAATQTASPTDLPSEAEEWQQWTATSPGYRLAAYADDFSSAGAFKPSVLEFEVPNWRDNAELQPLLELAYSALPSAPPSSGGNSGGNNAPAGSGLGVLLVAGLAFWFLFGRKS